jgi:hypothetical protein
MNASQVPTAQVSTNLSAWAAAAAGWANGGSGVDVALYTNDKVPSPTDQASDYTPCTITGAAALPTLVADVFAFSDGTEAISLPTLASYTPLIEPDPAVTAYGWYAKNHGTGKLVAAGRFTDPILLHNGVTVAFVVAVSGPLNWQFPNPTEP